MNIRDLLGPTLLAVGTVLLLKTFWFGFGGRTDISDTSFVAPLTRIEQEPLKLDVDYLDNEKNVSEDLVTVTTPYAEFQFSSQGGTVSKLTFLRTAGKNSQQFTTIGNPPALERDSYAFLVALDEKTPFGYKRESHTEDDKTARVVYSTSTDQGSIKKEFVIDKESHKMDLVLTVSPQSGKTMQPRLMWPSPYLKALDYEEVTSAIISDKAGKFVKNAEANLNFREGYFSPKTFGSEDKYFIHSMFEASNGFAYRAYYKTLNNHIISFLEAQPVAEETTWTISFYLGPKESATIAPVAPVLENALSYGFFSPVAKVMLYLLNLCNGYVNNFGIAIILITLLLKLLLLPFTFRGEQKMKKMQEYQQRITYLKQKFRDNPEAFKQAQTDLIQKHGMPGIGGCLPLFLQIPIFAGLYGALNNSIQLYRAPFTFWIKDLSMSDPYYILPVCIGFSVLLGSLSAGTGKKDVRQFMISCGLALFLAGWTSSMAAGLALFIFSNAFLHFIQTRIQKALGL